jgi:hypothetical protein
MHCCRVQPLQISASLFLSPQISKDHTESVVKQVAAQGWVAQQAEVPGTRVESKPAIRQAVVVRERDPAMYSWFHIRDKKGRHLSKKSRSYCKKP